MTCADMSNAELNASLSNLPEVNQSLSLSKPSTTKGFLGLPGGKHPATTTTLPVL